MKDVVLIQPNYVNVEKRYKINFHLAIQRYPPLHLAYLASSLEQANITVDIIDAAALRLSNDEVVELLKRTNPKIVGIHVNSFFLPIVYSLVQKIRSSLDCTIILGGPHITYQPYSTFKLGADYGFRGESEMAIVKFVNSDSKKEIPGLIYKDGNYIRINEPEHIKDLDSLPFPARHLLPQDEYYVPFFSGKTTTMITTRGCPFDCIFCARVIKRKYREISLDKVLEEIKQITETGIRYIQLQDDTFSFNKKRVKNLCESLIKEKIDIEWGCETRADTLDRELIEWLKKAGCTNVQIGVESGSERVRNIIIGKNLSTSAIKKTIKNLKEFGIESTAYFMFGLPTETYEEMKKTVAFAKGLNSDYVDFHLAIPIPGSRLFEIAVKEGKINKDIWDDVIFGEQIPIYVPNGTTLKQMIQLQKGAYREFYLRPRMFAKILKEIKGINDLYLKVKTGLIVLKNKCT